MESQSEDKYKLERFVEAQNDVYDTVLAELSQGRKESHWMWFIFPQREDLGFSYFSKYYGLSGVDEARAYLKHALLNERLREVCNILLRQPISDAREIFGGIDSRKLCSSMTIFDMVEPNSVYADVLSKFFDGHRCRRTLDIIKTEE
ncbi:MAG: DUF1810 domain-containing protein [Muribaculaceae bacterium]|nr:DUF1810 domain-containing protein [Muribaculaceae bacterium]